MLNLLAASMADILLVDRRWPVLIVLGAIFDCSVFNPGLFHCLADHDQWNGYLCDRLLSLRASQQRTGETGHTRTEGLHLGKLQYPAFNFLYFSVLCVCEMNKYLSD